MDMQIESTMTIILSVLRVEKVPASGVGRKVVLFESLVDISECGTIVDMAHFSAGGQNTICYATTKGKLCGWDFRSNRTVWELTNSAKHGV